MLYILFLIAAACAAILGVMVLVYGTVRWCRIPRDFRRFRGLDGSAHENALRIWWLSGPGVSYRILGRLKTRQEKTSEVCPPSEACAPRLTLSPKVGSV